MPAEAAKVLIEVTAGLFPGEVEPEHTRRWAITSGEWDAQRARGEAEILLLERHARAVAYATFLQLLCASGRSVNWTRIEFIWL